MGLFLMEDAREGERVAWYSGDPLTAAGAGLSTSAYLMHVNSNLVLDARDPSHELGRLINDGRISGRTVNVRFGARQTASTDPVTGRQRIPVFAKCFIPAGTAELLADYGGRYIWPPGVLEAAKRRRERHLKTAV